MLMDFLAEKFPDVSRMRLKEMLANEVYVDGRKTSQYNLPLQEGMVVSLQRKGFRERFTPQGLDIVYEDEDVILINKPRGMVVHPGIGHFSGTLVNALLYHLDHLGGIGGEMRPGIVHRLDKDTSGLLIVAKNDPSQAELSRQLQMREMEKHYLALVEGGMKEEAGRIEAPIARSQKDRKKMDVDPRGREAVTEWRVLARGRRTTLLDVHILTGRTHQIRVHLASIGHPILNDELYGKKSDLCVRMGLFAESVEMYHPLKEDNLTVEADLPKELDRRLRINENVMRHIIVCQDEE